MISETKIFLSRDQLLWIYQRMTLIRIFEEKLLGLIKKGVHTGPVHVYVGEEVVATGVCAALMDSDWISSTHRDHGHCIAKGVDVRRMMRRYMENRQAPIAGRADRCTLPISKSVCSA